jgi:Icc-related predicted phosphoesterase
VKIKLNESKIIETYPYLEVGSKTKGDSDLPEVFHKRLPIYYAEYLSQTAKVDLIIIASDLQGIAEEKGEQFLLGEQLPSFLKTLIEIEYPECKRIGVFLCGDLYTTLNKRGSSGDVRAVWDAFNRHFNWVVGVAGNHDRFGNAKDFEVFKANEYMHVLHKNSVEVDGIKIGGISGIIGRADKTNRVDELEYLKSLTSLAKKNLDFILLHETPDYPSLNLMGNHKIRAYLEHAYTTRVICGHCFWEQSLVELKNNTQVLNSDSKVILMKIVSSN